MRIRTNLQPLLSPQKQQQQQTENNAPEVGETATCRTGPVCLRTPKGKCNWLSNSGGAVMSLVAGRLKRKLSTDPLKVLDQVMKWFALLSRVLCTRKPTRKIKRLSSPRSRLFECQTRSGCRVKLQWENSRLRSIRLHVPKCASCYGWCPKRELYFTENII